MPPRMFGKNLYRVISKLVKKQHFLVFRKVSEFFKTLKCLGPKNEIRISLALLKAKLYLVNKKEEPEGEIVVTYLFIC